MISPSSRSAALCESSVAFFAISDSFICSRVISMFLPLLSAPPYKAVLFNHFFASDVHFLLTNRTFQQQFSFIFGSRKSIFTFSKSIYPLFPGPDRCYNTHTSEVLHCKHSCRIVPGPLRYTRPGFGRFSVHTSA